MSTSTQQEKAAAFRALHDGPVVLLMPNPWDVGSAQELARQGFAALATSSSASAAVIGRSDGELSRTQALAHIAQIAAAVDVPVSADLENGFGASPQEVAQAIHLAAEAGAVGGSIEDAGRTDAEGVYAINHAVERVAAAVEAARSLPFNFMLTARAENFVRGVFDLDDTIRRLQAFEAVGADVLFAPGLPDLKSIRGVCAAVSRPVNFMVGRPGQSFSVEALQAAGVRRISFGGSLYRASMRALQFCARDVLDRGSFGFVDTSTARADGSQ